MAGGGDEHASTVQDDAKDSESDGDAAEEILEESPCKRWSKRREKVKQRDVPGIDAAYLAMDNETGNEVVWNEVQFSERKNFRAQEEKINAVFDNLTSLVHTNLVKFHRYWTDTKSEKPRIIFITEYMSSGSMSVFLQRTRKSGTKSISLKAWKKWTTQILSALNYLHSSKPPISHGNLTCNTIFIQQNGLIKIGCGWRLARNPMVELSPRSYPTSPQEPFRSQVAPDAINHHVKTCRENLRNFYYMAPEFEYISDLMPAADIYAFGVCALEIALAGGPWASEKVDGPINAEYLIKCLSLIEDDQQREFLSLCLDKDPEKRPSARELLFHPCLFEVHSLKLLAAHSIVDSKMYDDVSDSVFRIPDNEKVAATARDREMAYCQVAAFQIDLEKFLDDVRNGIYPLTAFAPLAHQPVKIPGFTAVPSTSQQVAAYDDLMQPTVLNLSSTAVQRPDPDPTPSPPAQPEPEAHRESRQIVSMKVTMDGSDLTVWVQLEDSMNRQLTTEVSGHDDARSLTRDLVNHGFISETDSWRVERELVGALLTPPT